MRKIGYLFVALLCGTLLSCGNADNKVGAAATAEVKTLSELQQDFMDLRFGMFVHFNMPSYSTHDWPDPDMPAEIFNPEGMDCGQWADAAVSAGMTYGCLTTKHHSGFCVWNTATTDYCVGATSFGRDVVREYADAFRARGLKVMLYYSILDIHHDIRAGWAGSRKNIDFIKAQLTELLSNYGEITALVVDGWDAEWSRISYYDVPFREIYEHVKSLQPNCLICEHNAGKYPSSVLFYTDVKHYEQNAGQKISRETNRLPAQAGIPINEAWFWRENFPTSPVVSAEEIVFDNLIPLNEAHCNFILNVAPNRNGLIDANVIAELSKIGSLWKHAGKAPQLEKAMSPVIARNLAYGCRMDSSWSLGKRTSDLASDDDFTTCWVGQEAWSEHYLEVVFDNPVEFDAVAFVESTDPLKYPVLETTRIGSYELSWYDGNKWQPLEVIESDELVRVHRFENSRKASRIKLLLHDCKAGIGISEMMVYKEK